ncbi:MAG: ABC-type multidrug transport system, permease component [Bacilli bacterium]|nr:ABC-type multidrug transport system, permease component [Bacilli bacterium]
MNIYRIFIISVKQQLRNKSGWIMGLLFPIVLMLILGTTLAGSFDHSAKYKDINVLYKNSPNNTALSLAFQGLIQHGKEIGIQFTAAENAQQGIESIENGKYASFVNVDENGLELYKNENNALKAGLVEAALGSFLQRYKAVSEIANETHTIVNSTMQASQPEDHVKVSSLGDRKLPKAMDYYAVTMLTFLIIAAAFNGMGAIDGERSSNTASRLLCSPVKKHEILIGKILGMVLFTLLQALILIGFSKYIMNAYWGVHLGAILFIVIPAIVMAVSFGVGLALLIKNGMLVMQILQMGMNILIFLGGGYFPIDKLGKVMQSISNVSPVKWINQAIFGVIYSGDFSSAQIAILLCLVLAVLFIILSSISFRKGALR